MATLLIADADTTHALSMQAALEGEGHSVHTAHDGHDALEICQATLPDLVFAAVNLPVITGFELATMLANDPDMPPGQVVVLLHSEPLDTRAVERCRAHASLERGCDSHTLREHLVAWLGPRAAAE